MKVARFVAPAALVAGALLGCTKETTHGPVQWTASNPASPVGQTAAQAWSRSTSNDALKPPPEAPPAASVESVPAEACPCRGEAPAPSAGAMAPGVTSSQPPAARWPYNGATLILTPIQ
jgi:hypothetical protein